MFKWLCRLPSGRCFHPGEILTRWVESTRREVGEVEAAIEIAWRSATARPGVSLFDGPIARCEGWTLKDGRLEIQLSRSSYRISVGTHFANPHFIERFGPQVMSMPLGVSTGLFCRDNTLVMGVRTDRVAYYPNRVHPFAGSLDVRDPLDVFDDARRELQEELNLTPNQIAGLRCVGIAQDQQLAHPELIFLAHTTLSLDELSDQLDASEHTALVKVDPRDERLTPLGRAVVQAAGEYAG